MLPKDKNMAKLTKEIKKKLAEAIKDKLPELARNISLLFAYAPISVSIAGETKILDRMSIEHLFSRLLDEWIESNAPALFISNFYISAEYKDGWQIHAGYALEVSANEKTS